MKREIRLLTVFIFSLSLTSSIAQKTETSILFNTGLFSFAGSSAYNSTFVNYDKTTNLGYANNPYGSRNGLCYGFSFQKKRITKWNFIYGFDLGYEILRSKVSINGIYSDSFYSAKGKTILNFGFVNFYPFIGFRINTGNISFDISGGFELALKLKSWESGKAETDKGVEITMPSTFSNSNLFDFRRRLQVAVNYKRISPYIGYSRGLVNYLSGITGGSNNTYARMIRVGIAYKL